MSGISRRSLLGRAALTPVAASLPAIDAIVQAPVEVVPETTAEFLSWDEPADWVNIYRRVFYWWDADGRLRFTFSDPDGVFRANVAEPEDRA